MSITTESAPSTVAADLASFVCASPSSYHAAANVRERLVAAGFTELAETEAWDLRAGGRYVVVRDGAAIAWVMPEVVGGAEAGAGSGAGAGAREAGGASAPVFRVFGTHTDSPAFKLKPNPGFTTEGALQIGVEIYGGPLLNSWLDRELSLAGRLVTRDGQTMLARTKPIARIPQLAIHLDREVNQKLALDKQRHLQPVIGLEDLTGLLRAADGLQSNDVLEVLAASAGVKAADVAGFDVVTIAAQEPATFGLHDEFLASPRLDNLSSVHAGMSALALIDPAEISEIPLLAAFDHEEVGSNTRSGACGPFLADVTERIVAAAVGAGAGAGGGRAGAAGAGGAGGAGGGGREAYLRSMAGSICFSADTGHGVHPNYPERHDPVNRPRLGAGPLLKINAQQRYATDAIGTARFAAACDAADVAYQEFVSNNSMPCGSTIGPLTATRLGMTTVDIGIGLWSMHSAREMCAVTDVHDMFAVAYAYMRGA
ncbi:M18 family aminopeptidase [Brevibacterium otitidis]|uniref:M18 family aminopeptidase n=1 Tax=Brevibacterium otitidis TaxID=53364 RepID=A0ABV5X1F8_9MICO|nr:M18 family aminopeptidase [Brevibacterium otitidis]BFF08648.1 M18 family aminopeptidase [Brevibacterium otitidis]